jgi:3-oxoadipate enol-lactonase
MAYYSRDDRRNYYIEFGSGDPVLLLHGITNSGRAWAPQLAPLVKAGFRVIVPDHAGHGASGRLEKAFGIEEIAADTEMLLNHLGIRSAHLVGVSLGGMIALQMALRASDRVGRMVVANSLASITPELRTMLGEWASTFRRPDGPVIILEQAWPSLVNRMFQTSDEGQWTYQVWHGVAASAHGPSLAYVCEGLVGFDVTGELANVRKATLFLAGEEDTMSSPQVSRRLADTVLHARFAELPGASHLSNVDSAKHFNEALIRFLAAE